MFVSYNSCFDLSFTFDCINYFPVLLFNCKLNYIGSTVRLSDIIVYCMYRIFCSYVLRPIDVFQVWASSSDDISRKSFSKQCVGSQLERASQTFTVDSQVIQSTTRCEILSS